MNVNRKVGYIEDWLCSGGLELGFNSEQLPAMQDIDWILEYEITSDVYFSSSLFRMNHREFIKLTKGVE